MQEILECLLSIDLLLKGLDMLSDDLITTDLVELLLRVCLGSEDPNVLGLTAHLIHLLCSCPSKFHFF